MGNSFPRLRSGLDGDRGWAQIVIVSSALALAAAWIAWAFGARVTRYEVSDQARLEVEGAASPIQADVSGRLVASHLVLGQQIKQGDVLIELDADGQRLGLAEQKTRGATLQPQKAALQMRLESEERGRVEERRVLQLALEGAQAQYKEAEARAALAGEEAERARRLRAEGVIADTEAARAKAEAQSRQAAAENLLAIRDRLEPEQEVREQTRDIRLQQLREEMARLEADAFLSEAAVRRLNHEVDRRVVRAPVSGIVAEWSGLKAGAYINEGQQIGLILPQGRLHVVAEFAPSLALGKLRAGQKATMRLQGFPWAQYGTVPATVSRVADEVRDGKVRVELAVNGKPPARIPYQHGLPGQVDVQVERVSPAVLLLRSAGQMAGGR